MTQRTATVQNPPDCFVCPTCFAANDMRNDFCQACRAPLSGTSSIDPIKSIWARGFLYREMSHGRPSRIVLIGAWLLVGGSAFSFLLSSLSGFLTAIPCALVLALHAVILYRTTKNCLRKINHPADGAPPAATSP